VEPACFILLQKHRQISEPAYVGDVPEPNHRRIKLGTGCIS